MRSKILCLVISLFISNIAFSIAYQESDFSKKLSEFRNSGYVCDDVKKNKTIFELGLEQSSDGDSEWYSQIQAEFANKCPKEFIGLLLSYDRHLQQRITHGMEIMFMTEQLRMRLKETLQVNPLKSNLDKSLNWILGN